MVDFMSQGLARAQYGFFKFWLSYDDSAVSAYETNYFLSSFW